MNINLLKLRLQSTVVFQDCPVKLRY